MIMSTKEICKRGLSMTISLTLGNSPLPLADGFVGNMEPLGQLTLGETFFPALGLEKRAERLLIQLIHTSPPSRFVLRLQCSSKCPERQSTSGRILDVSF